MKKWFKDWKPFEIGLLVSGVLAISASAIIFKSEILTLVTSLVGIFCAILQAKGKVLSQFVGIAEVILYSILSYPIKTTTMERLSFML